MPPPTSSAGRGSRARPAGSESATSVSDDAFSSSETRISEGQSKFRSLSPFPPGILFISPCTETSSAVPTEETLVFQVIFKARPSNLPGLE
ncbi:hypothetical protein BGW80DRAFT_1401371, partial [Lactifluus volemus]